MSTLNLALIKARAETATTGPWKTWAMSVLADPVGNSNLDDGIRIANTFFTIDGHPRTNDADFIAAARTDIPALLAEVDRLTRIVNGYDRTPAEQRAAEAEAEVDSLRASNGQIRGDLARLRAENAGLREADLRSRAEQHALAVDVDHVAADCPVCRYALGLAEPASAAVGPWTGPVAANRPRDGWMRHTEAGDVADATITIEPDVSGFEAQS